MGVRNAIIDTLHYILDKGSFHAWRHHSGRFESYEQDNKGSIEVLGRPGSAPYNQNLSP
jgi:hypothetical protein